MTIDYRVKDYMTAHPHTIGLEQSLAKAKEMMLQYGIRHLPVLEGGNLVGVITDRDMKFVETFPDTNTEKMTVGEALIREAYTVSPQDALKDVCAKMAEEKYGCALVVGPDAKLVGIFSWVDGLRASARHIPPPSEASIDPELRLSPKE